MVPSARHKQDGASPKRIQATATAHVLYSDSEKDSNMLYATGVFVPDPFLFIQYRGRKHIVISDMEYVRVKSEARVDYVYSYREVIKHLRETKKKSVDKPSIDEICLFALKMLKIQRIEVPRNFPFGLGHELQKRGLSVRVKQDPFFPERSIKTEQEVQDIRGALRATEHGMRIAMEALKASRWNKKKGRELLLGPEKLTSERMRGLIQKAVLDKHCHAMHTIVACGRQGYDPHRTGEGPLRANEPIIVDIFPRSEISGYYGDMTRTFVKGKASEKVKDMYHAVKKGQDYAFSQILPGVQARKIHKEIITIFEKIGFSTYENRGEMAGFIHGTGHGLGLDIHEHPTISERPCRLRRGNVVTVEPGLYYPDLGGVRLEDVVWVQPDGIKKLSRFPRCLELE